MSFWLRRRAKAQIYSKYPKLFLISWLVSWQIILQSGSKLQRKNPSNIMARLNCALHWLPWKLSYDKMSDVREQGEENSLTKREENPRLRWCVLRAECLVKNLSPWFQISKSSSKCDNWRHKIVLVSWICGCGLVTLWLRTISGWSMGGVQHNSSHGEELAPVNQTFSLSLVFPENRFSRIGLWRTGVLVNI